MSCGYRIEVKMKVISFSLSYLHRILLTINTSVKSTTSGWRTTTPSWRRMLQSSSISATAFFVCSSGKGFPQFSWIKPQDLCGMAAMVSRVSGGTQAPGIEIKNGTRAWWRHLTITPRMLWGKLLPFSIFLLLWRIARAWHTSASQRLQRNAFW